MIRGSWPRGASVALLCVLALLAYYRALFYPFIADDYIQIRWARGFTPPEKWHDLAADPLTRCRTTSLFVTAATDRLFGLNPVAYNASSVILHAILATLVLVLGRSLGFSPAVSLAAAAFYAVYEGHQEAVIWYAALPEQLVVIFAVLSLLLWIRWVRGEGGWRCYAGSLAIFVLALFSKESSVAVVPLLLLTAWWGHSQPWRKVLAAGVPYAALAAIYTALIFLARDQHGFFHDGTFVLSWRFLEVIPHSMVRMLFFWGLLAAVLVGRQRTLAFCLGWMAVALLPYSFIGYMNRVPSRHTYFAAVGLALLVGSGWQIAAERWRPARPWLAPAVAVLVVFHNCAYLWTRKHEQYLERAAPTERLLAHLHAHRRNQGPVWVLNFPYDKYVADSAVAVATDRPSDSVVISSRPPKRGVHTLRWNEDRLEFEVKE